jgi:hypothetical protein
VPLEQPVHDVGIFGINIYGIDWTEWLVFRNIRADGVEQEALLLAAEQS